MSSNRRFSGYLIGGGLALAVAAFTPAAFAQGGAAGDYGGATAASGSASGSPAGGPYGSHNPVASYPNSHVNAPGAPANGSTAPGTGGGVGLGNGSGAGNAAVAAGHPVGYGHTSSGGAATNKSDRGDPMAGGPHRQATTGWGSKSTSGNAAYP